MYLHNREEHCLLSASKFPYQTIVCLAFRVPKRKSLLGRT